MYALHLVPSSIFFHSTVRVCFFAVVKFLYTRSNVYDNKMMVMTSVKITSEKKKNLKQKKEATVSVVIYISETLRHE